MAAVPTESTTALGTLEHVRAIAPYQAGKPIEELAREFGLDPASIVKLASNENPLGAPESAKKAMAAAVEDLGLQGVILFVVAPQVAKFRETFASKRRT